MKGITIQSSGEFFDFPGEFCTPLQVYREFYQLTDAQVLERFNDGRLPIEPEDFRRLVKLIKIKITERREKTRKFKALNSELQTTLF